MNYELEKEISLPSLKYGEESKVDKYCQWSISGSKFYPAFITVEKLESGFYEVGRDQQGYYLHKKETSTDTLYGLPNPELKDIVEDIENFWKRVDIYKKYGFLHKRGVLMYGAPGNGKSGIIQLCTKYLIQTMGGIVVNLSNGDQIEWFGQISQHLRDIEPERPLIVILEDIDGIAGEGSWSTSMLLNMLDGVKQINNVVYIATTNYPEKLEERITNRPSRFDRRYEILSPSNEVRKTFLNHKLIEGGSETTIDMDLWLEKTEGMSLSHLKELFISVVVMGCDFTETLNTLNGLSKKPIIKSKNKSVGFTS
jgi:ATP-dependent 26S proteasome regulatory subunit